MKFTRIVNLMFIVMIFSICITACNLPKGESTSSKGQIPTLDKTEQEWLGEVKPTPTQHAGKVGSGIVQIDSLVRGLGSDLEVSVKVPFTIFRTSQGAYQILGSNIGTMRMDLEGTGCVCDGDYEVNSEINGSINVANTGECKIEFSETRTILSGDCECDCPNEQMSCEDAFPDIEEIGPFLVDFNNGAQHFISGDNNGLSYDYMWVFNELKLNTTDCFFPEVITISP